MSLFFAEFSNTFERFIFRNITLHKKLSKQKNKRESWPGEFFVCIVFPKICICNFFLLWEETRINLGLNGVTKMECLKSRKVRNVRYICTYIWTDNFALTLKKLIYFTGNRYLGKKLNSVFFSSVLLYKRTVFENPQKVSFNIASKASYVYIMSGQKLIKNAKNYPFWRVFENVKLAVKQCYQTGHF